MIAVSDGPHAPSTVLDRLASDGGLARWRVLSGWIVGDEPYWLSRLAKAGGWSVMGSGGARAAIDDGRLRYLPVRLSCLPKLLSDTIRPDVTVVRARPSGSGFVLAPSIGWALSACRTSQRVVVEVDPSLAKVPAPSVPGSGHLVVESETPCAEPRPAIPDETDCRIGRLVASLVPAGATIQHGPGAIAEAVMGALERPVSVFSGMVSESLVSLAERGLLFGKPAVAGYLYGGRPLESLAESGAVRLAGVEQTHNLGALAGIERFVALNTAVQVGLDGAVNVESVGGRTIAGVGGHPDFSLGASLSVGGLSVVALRSRSSKGTPTLVERVDRVSTSPTDVDVVVTEHGIADLRGKDGAERRAELLAVSERT